MLVKKFIFILSIKVPQSNVHSTVILIYTMSSFLEFMAILLTFVCFTGSKLKITVLRKLDWDTFIYLANGCVFEELEFITRKASY